MDPITIVTTVTSMLVPYIRKAGEEAAKEIAEQPMERINTIWNTISNRFKEKPDAFEALKEFSDHPEDSDIQTAFRIQLKRALVEDAGFANQLSDLIEQAKPKSNINVGGNISIGGNVSGDFVVGNRLPGDSTTDAPPPKKKKDK